MNKLTSLPNQHLTS